MPGSNFISAALHFNMTSSMWRPANSHLRRFTSHERNLTMRMDAKHECLCLSECRISRGPGDTVSLSEGAIFIGDSRCRNLFTAMLRVNDPEGSQIVERFDVQRLGQPFPDGVVFAICQPDHAPEIQAPHALCSRPRLQEVRAKLPQRRSHC